mgnify:CR=1 FL=1|tara:strand:- start:5709 stop:6239 length:531 start_codon:yes stop_codon:yes gene_type:complete
MDSLIIKNWLKDNYFINSKKKIIEGSNLNETNSNDLIELNIDNGYDFLIIKNKFMLSFFHNEFFPILIFLSIAIALGTIILVLSYVLVFQNPETEKLSTYECGFEPYEDARHKFDVKFYLVAILFIVFDVEAMYLFPWSVSLSNINSVGFCAMIDFIIELGIGFAYVWFLKALEWD